MEEGGIAMKECSDKCPIYGEREKCMYYRKHQTGPQSMRFVCLYTAVKEFHKGRGVMEHNSDKIDFSKLRKVDRGSIEANLFGLIDDIDTAGDMFKPEQTSYYKYVMRRVEKARQYIVSDGYDLYYRKASDEKGGE
jgi:hypothetical protein